MDDGDNCNADAEVLTWGARPFLRENDVIGTPTNPAPAPIIGLNAVRYLGDACDPAACTDLAKRDAELDATNRLAQQAQAPFSIARLWAFGASAKVLGVHRQKGRLAAAPFLTERSLSIATQDAQGVRFAELPLTAFDPPVGVGLDSAWK